ncbi:hypothetical protein EGT86_13415 [Burkholderia pseudomallei]|nr:hypothetical protein EGT86_13415 [Burkholderia pseudomallei]
MPFRNNRSEDTNKNTNNRIGVGSISRRELVVAMPCRRQQKRLEIWR